MIQEYINSGILESYVIGAATEQEANEVLRMKAKYPEVRDALEYIEFDMEAIANKMAIALPIDTWNKIERELKELIPSPEAPPQKFTHKQNGNNGYKVNGNNYIEVESESTEIRIHKNWKWVFAAVFVLGKIFLGCAIYFYLENRQAQQQINELKTEIHALEK